MNLPLYDFLKNKLLSVKGKIMYVKRFKKILNQIKSNHITLNYTYTCMYGF